MKLNAIFNNINVKEKLRSTITKGRTSIENCLLSTYTRKVLNSVQPYVESAKTLALTTILFKTISSLYSENYIFYSIIASLTTGGVAGLVSTSYRQKIQQVTVIGIGLLANQILVPVCLPMYSLPTIATIFFNLIGVSLVLGNKESSDPINEV